MTSENLLIVLASNNFQVISRRRNFEKDKLQKLGTDERKWMNLKSKIFDFS